MNMLKMFCISTGESFVYDATSNKIIRVLDNRDASIEQALRDRIIVNKQFETINYPHSFEKYCNLLETELPRLVIEITQQCNLRCKYCIYSDNYSYTREHNFSSMDWQTLKKSIDFYIKHSVNINEYNITFYGGEPLIEFQLIKKAIEYIKKRRNGKAFYVGVSTNGTLINDEVIEYLENNSNVKLNITLNGPYHDKYRTFADGSGSLDVIKNNLEKIIKTNKLIWETQINFVCNISSEKELMEIRKFYMDTLGKTPTLITKISVSDSSDYIKSITKIAESERENLQKLFADLYLKENDDFMHSYFRLELYGLFERKIHKCNKGYIGSCFPLLSQLFVNVNGDFSICEKTPFNCALGNVNDGFNYDVIEKIYLDLSKKTNEKCKDCWAQRLCTFCFKDCLSADSKCNFDKLKCDKMRDHILWCLKLYCEIAYNYPTVYKRYKNDK